MNDQEHVLPPFASGLVLVPKWAGEFKSFAEWVNRASRVLTVRREPPICVDSKGRRCYIGKDFMLARDEGVFPVRYFWECELAPAQEWVSVEDRLPVDGETVLAWAGDQVVIERWMERHESPVGWSSATMPIGPAWDEHEFEEITHWMSLPPPPSTDALPRVRGQGET